MEDPETQRLIEETQRCIRQSHDLIKHLESSAENDRIFVRHVRQMVNELNQTLEHQLKTPPAD